MKAPLILLCAFLWALPCFAQTRLDPADNPFHEAATPAPAPQVVYLPAPVSTTDKITAWGLIATAAITTLFALVGFALKKIIEVKPLVDQLLGRADRQAAKSGSLQAQITQVATLVPPPAVVIPVQAPPDIAVAPATAPPASPVGPPSRVPIWVAAMGLGAAMGLLASCTNAYYPSGQRMASVGSNVGHFAMTSGNTTLVMDGVDNAIIHREAGNNTQKLGVSIATSGILPWLKGLF